MTDDQKRQLYLLGGLLVALAVILYFQWGKLRQIREEEEKYSPEAMQEQMRSAKIRIRVGTGPSDLVEVTGMEIFDPGMSIVSVHEVEAPEKRHLVWVYPNPPSPYFVSLDFLPQAIVDATRPLFRGLSWQSGAMEWEEGERTVRGIPDGVGDYFDISDSSPELTVFHRHLPTRDAVPPLTYPRSVTAEAALAEQVMGTTLESYLADDDLVLGLELGGTAKAYPIKIMNYHELVNDTFGDELVAVVYSPLSGSGMAYRARVGDGTSLFGHSGLLLESATVIYDHKTRSLWSHFEGKAEAGPSRGEQLEALPLLHTTWKSWRERHPETMVMSSRTGFQIRYGVDPYRDDIRTDYYAIPALAAPIRLPDGGYDFARIQIDERLPNKAWVVGIRGEATHHAFPISELAHTEQNPMVAEVDGKQVKIVFDPESETGFAVDMAGNPLAEATLALWFAWQASYPDTELFLVEAGPS